jgi:hypothetical protein
MSIQVKNWGLQSEIRDFLVSYRSLSLEKTEKVKLMRRMDTKYLIPADEVIGLLYDIRQDYHVLEIESQRTGAYTSIYYDTSDRQMFHSHVTGRFPRYKVRERFYSQNGLKFFEVKQKSNTGRICKKRISVDDGIRTRDWLSEQSPFHTDDLTPALMVYFERITLINNLHTERVTIDFNLHFRTPTGDVTPVYDRVAIVELKQEKAADSPIREHLRSKGIRPGGVSKYCAGMLLSGCETGFKQYKPNYSRFVKIL